MYNTLTTFPGPFTPPPEYGAPPPPPPRRRSGIGCLGYIVIAILAYLLAATLIMGLLPAIMGSNSDVPASSYNREPIHADIGFNNNCIVDELDWFDNIGQTSRRLENFFDKTGVQPFIYLKAYDSALTTDAEKTEFAEDWYEDNIDNEGTFLFMYFAEENQDEDVGYMAHVNGKQVSSVMDAEAVEIFWSFVDNNWYSDKSTDDMFVNIFNSTADRIMTKTTTGNDVGKTALVVILVAVGLVGVLVIMKTRRKHEAERNVETERILNADLHDSGSSGDPTLDKWS